VPAQHRFCGRTVPGGSGLGLEDVDDALRLRREMRGARCPADPRTALRLRRLRWPATSRRRLPASPMPQSLRNQRRLRNCARACWSFCARFIFGITSWRSFHPGSVALEPPRSRRAASCGVVSAGEFGQPGRKSPSRGLSAGTQPAIRQTSSPRLHQGPRLHGAPRSWVDATCTAKNA